MKVDKYIILDDLIVSIRELFEKERFCVFQACFSIEHLSVYSGTLAVCGYID